ncbi:hypothetical protein H0H87_003876 [Tephrocybe sp. NHM501043]|nr:hypothetical protein H0H87_003876 [Tephrocybe sp. NHM501043]
MSAIEAVMPNTPNLASVRSAGPPLGVPAEIWLRIAQHLPHRDLVRLLGLNRVFLGLVMDRRHREFRLTDSPDRFMQQIEHLRIPSAAVASRVEVLTIAPQRTWESIQYQTPLQPYENTIQERRPASPPKIAIKSFSGKNSSVDIPIERPSTPPDVLSPSAKCHAVECAAQTLVNLKDLRVVWFSKEAGCIRQSFRPFCPFIEALLPAFGHNLRALSLTVPASVMAALTLDTKVFGNLEEVNIKFDGEQSQGFGPCLSPCMVSFLPLINGSSPTLKTLKIEAMGLLGNLSMFFNAMREFPHLTTLSLIMPLGPALLPDPSGLNRLLSHAIQDLVIRFKYGPSLVAPYTATDILDWYDRVVQGVSFNTLHRIQLGFFASMNRDLRRHYQSPVRPLFQCLTSLDIVDVHLSFEEVPFTLSAFNGRLLRQLSLVVKTLCLELIDVIAAACPDLEQLCIYYDTLKDPIHSSLCTVVSSGPTRPRSYALREVDTHLFQSRFCAKMKEVKTTSKWRLYDIDVWMIMPPNHLNQGERKRKRQWDVMRSISAYVPAITSFAGQGHMRDETECDEKGRALSAWA